MFDNAKIELNEKNVDALGNISVFPAEVKDLFEIGEEALTPAQTILNSVSKNAEEMLTEDVFFNEGLNADELRLCAAKAKGNQMRKVSMMRTSASVSAGAAAPIDVSSAVPVNVDTLYNLNNFSVGNHLLLKVTTNGIAKLTSAIQFGAETVVGTVIFTVDENSIPTIVADSVNRLKDFDVVSFLPQDDTYYVLYSVYSGGGSVVFTLQSSTTLTICSMPSLCLWRRITSQVFSVRLWKRNCRVPSASRESARKSASSPLSAWRMYWIPTLSVATASCALP